MSGNKILLKIMGRKIRLARESKGITTKEVCDELKMSLSTVNCIERGERTGKNWIIYVCYLKKKGININSIFDSAPDKKC